MNHSSVTQPKKNSIFLAGMGTLIEYYDYVIFVTFLPIISPVFFSGGSSYQALIKGYYVLLIAMLARPLGGLFFGYIGDRFGRRIALLGSMYGIAVATLMIGIVPSHHLIGVYAAISIVILKSIQLFCFGGEYNGAGIYVVECAQNAREATASAKLAAMTLTGSLLAASVGVLCTSTFMPSWSWRLAFIAGGIVGIIGIIWRKQLIESPAFVAATKQQLPLKTLLKKYPKQLFAGVCIGGFSTLPFTTVFSFLNPVFVSKGILSNHQFMWLETALSFIAILILLQAGSLADKYSPRKIMLYGAAFLVIFSIPLALTIEYSGLILIICAQIGLVIINEIMLGPSNAYLKNLFAPQYRYRASSLSFCLGMTVVSGITPLIENALYQTTHHLSAISIWLVFIGALTFLAIQVNEKSSSQTTCPAAQPEAHAH